MTTAEREKIRFGDGAQLVSETADSAVYRLRSRSGEMQMVCHQVFPGIELIYRDAHMHGYTVRPTSEGRLLEITHCREGRVEYGFDDELCYLEPGDLSVARRDDAGHGAWFPTGHYHGLSVLIDIDRAPACLSCILDDVNVRPQALLDKFCGDRRFFVTRSNPGVSHLFSELYSVPDSIRRAYFKVKMLELLLFLSAMDVSEDQRLQRCVPRAQAQLARKVCAYLTAHMDSRVTLEEMTGVLHVSGTQIKNSFRSVYGISVYAYIRTQKMQAAARMLRETDCTVLEIAGKYAYDNSSKFARAFKDTFGMTPSEYRAAAAAGTLLQAGESV